MSRAIFQNLRNATCSYVTMCCAGGVALMSKPGRSISDSNTSIGLFDKQRRLQLAWTQDDYKTAGPIPEQVCIASTFIFARINRKKIRICRTISWVSIRYNDDIAGSTDRINPLSISMRVYRIGFIANICGLFQRTCAKCLFELSPIPPLRRSVIIEEIPRSPTNTPQAPYNHVQLLQYLIPVRYVLL